MSAAHRSSFRMADDDSHHRDRGILPNKVGGGPHGVGDPDDKTLRKVEVEVCIAAKIREKAKNEKCVEEVKAFTECGKANGLLLPFLCRKQNTALQDCMGKWFFDKAFVEECTQEYLEERSEFRRTGIRKKEKRRGSVTF